MLKTRTNIEKLFYVEKEMQNKMIQFYQKQKKQNKNSANRLSCLLFQP